MGENSDASEACSSGSEDETLEQHEYERRRELYMSKMIFCEKKVTELKPLLLKLKMAELNKYQEDLRNRTAESYLSKKAILDEEFSKKRKHLETIHSLGLEQLLRLEEGRLQMIENSRNNHVEEAKQEIRDTIIEKVNKQKEIESIYLIYLIFMFIGITGLCTEEALPTKYIRIEENISNYLYKDPKTEMNLWRNIPVIIEQLAQHLIEEDMKAFAETQRQTVNGM